MKVKFTKPLKTRGTSSDPLRYQQGLRNSRKEVRNPAPELVRGEASVLRDLVATARVKDCLTTGVLSSAEGMAKVSKIVQQDIMQSFEKVITVGLPKGKIYFVWVRHTEHQRVELHFTIFRELIGDGRRFTAYLKKLDHLLITRWQWLTNLKYELLGPEAAPKARLVKPCLGYPPETAQKMNALLQQQFEEHGVFSRREAWGALVGAGFVFWRHADGGRSMGAETEDGKSVRVAGPVFQPSFDLQRYLMTEELRVRLYRQIVSEPHKLEAEFLDDLKRREQRQRQRYLGLAGSSPSITAQDACIRLNEGTVARLELARPSTAPPPPPTPSSSSPVTADVCPGPTKPRRPFPPISNSKWAGVGFNPPAQGPDLDSPAVAEESPPATATKASPPVSQPELNPATITPSSPTPTPANPSPPVSSPPLPAAKPSGKRRRSASPKKNNSPTESRPRQLPPIPFDWVRKSTAAPSLSLPNSLTLEDATSSPPVVPKPTAELVPPKPSTPKFPVPATNPPSVSPAAATSPSPPTANQVSTAPLASPRPSAPPATAPLPPLKAPAQPAISLPKPSPPATDPPPQPKKPPATKGPSLGDW